MKKDIEWLKEEIKKLITEESQYMPHDEMVDLGLVLLTIDQLDEPEKPVIPQFVADWIEETKRQSKSLVFAITHIYDKNEIGKSPNKEEERIFQWMELADNEEVFARAWLDGYEVEKEKLYKVELPTERLHHILTMHGDGKGHFFGKEHTNNFWYRTYLTEAEIKTIDERYWAFAQEVTE